MRLYQERRAKSTQAQARYIVKLAAELGADVFYEQYSLVTNRPPYKRLRYAELVHELSRSQASRLIDLLIEIQKVSGDVPINKKSARQTRRSGKSKKNAHALKQKQPKILNPNIRLEVHPGSAYQVGQERKDARGLWKVTAVIKRRIQPDDPSVWGKHLSGHENTMGQRIRWELVQD